MQAGRGKTKLYYIRFSEKHSKASTSADAGFPGKFGAIKSQFAA
jgi:hypothetical protein